MVGTASIQAPPFRTKKGLNSDQWQIATGYWPLDGLRTRLGACLFNLRIVRVILLA